MRKVSTIRSAIGSASRAFRPASAASRCPEAETSRANLTKSGRSRSGPDTARLATASASDIPARTDDTSRSHTSGHRPRRSLARRRARDCNQATGAYAPTTPARSHRGSVGKTSHTSAAAIAPTRTAEASTVRGLARSAKPASPINRASAEGSAGAVAAGRAGHSHGERTSNTPAPSIAPTSRIIGPCSASGVAVPVGARGGYG